MQNPIKDQLGNLFIQLQDQLTPEQRSTFVKGLAALQHSTALLYELQQADGIIHNCINNMTEEQRLDVAYTNHLHDLSAQWAFRSVERKESIERACRLLGGKNGK